MVIGGRVPLSTEMLFFSSTTCMFVSPFFRIQHRKLCIVHMSLDVIIRYHTPPKLPISFRVSFK